MRRITCLWILLSGCVSLFAQVKTLQATKTLKAPVIDGTLDDAAWQTAPPATDFTQYFPEAGSPAAQKTVVRVLYDDAAIYIGAYLYDDPQLIRRQITARDEELRKDLDYFSVFLDTYQDQQNGFQFLVTSSNVQTDARIATNPNLTLVLGDFGDKTWDAVWDSKIAFTPDGWTIEMKIPYFSLRFSKKNIQDWGIQFLRSVRRNNQFSFWNNVNPEVNGFVNQFGVLQNLVDLKPPLRLNFSPYISTGFRSTPENDGYRTEFLKSGGMDVKYGINESFTLDATLVPDFGQVISDNVVNNLTPYEVRFDEYRPFFTEGTEIFNKSGLFYSRRIGAMPTGYRSVLNLAANDPNLEVIKNPGRTQLYNAVKFSGRTEKKLGIGVFNAIGASMHAVVRDKTTGERTRYRTEPVTNYNIFVLDQALKGRSYVTLTNTNVVRSGASQDANVSGLDFSLYNKRNIFNLKGYVHYSYISGPEKYDGYNTQLRFGKVSGRFQYSVQNLIRSRGYDPTDLGYLQTANQHINSASVSYNRFTPGRTFLNYTYLLSLQYARIYEPDKFNTLTVQASGYWIFKNFWDATLAVGYLPDQHDYFVLERPMFDRYARRPQYGYINLSGSTDSRKKLFVNYNVLMANFFKNPEKEYSIIEGGVRYRFSNKFSLEASHRYEAETDYITYVEEDVTGEPVIGFVDFKDVTSLLSGIYNFTPRINLTLRARHYWSRVVYNRFSNVDAKGNPVDRPFTPGYDDNFNVFNVDAFFTWDFRYGSRLIIGYKNWLGENEQLAPVNHRRYLNNLGGSLGLNHGNEATIRFIYFLDYNQLRRR